MKYFSFVAVILIISVIIIASFFFIGDNEVEDYTKEFIQEIIQQNYSEKLSDEDNEKINQFFLGFQNQNLPHPIIENVTIIYYDAFTHPVHNGDFLQYISVKYDQVDASTFDTDINIEYISYTEEGNIAEIYFGQIFVRSHDEEFTDIEIIDVRPVEKQ